MSEDLKDAALTYQQNEALTALGLFVLSWSTLEGTLEVAISKLLDLDALAGSTLTAGQQFKQKITLLNSLLVRDPTKYSKAIETAKKVKSTERNDILHGIAGRDENGLTFTRRTNYGVFRSELREFSAVKLYTLTVEISSLATQLQQDLGITKKDYVDFFETAQKEQAKP